MDYRKPQETFRGLVSAAVCFLGGGCSWGVVPIQELTPAEALAVSLDANARAHAPGRQIKFYVDITNKGGRTVDLSGLKVELEAVPVTSPQTVTFREDWSFRWQTEVRLRPGKKITVPIVPEKGVEFPLELLRQGDYDIVAVVNERFRAPPYRLKVVRPDLELPSPGSSGQGQAAGKSS